MKTDWKSWSPFQSPEVREICAHMNDTERAELARRAGGYGVWVAFTFAIPLSFAITYRHPAHVITAVILIAVHIICVPMWTNAQKRFLCSTEWAREQGFTPDRIRLFAFR